MQYVKEGRAFSGGFALHGARAMDEALPGFGVEDDAHDPAAEFMGERKLAAAVFSQAFMDLGVRMPGTRGRAGSGQDEETVRARASARLFLYDPAWKRMREHWLALLGMVDEDFQRLLARPEFQGQANRVLAIRGLEAERAWLDEAGTVTQQMLGRQDDALGDLRVAQCKAEAARAGVCLDDADQDDAAELESA